MRIIEVSAPGKLMLSGEWSVLEVGIPCIVLAVNRKVHCKIKEAKEIELNAPDIGIQDLKGEFKGGKLRWKKKLNESEKEELVLPEKAIELTLRYLEDIGTRLINFSITTKSDISQVVLENGSTTKIGFGSSAAAVVAIVGAILKLHGISITAKEDKDRIYKLAAAAHYIGQGKIGSAFDIAASTYGGAVVYYRSEPDWLTGEINSERRLSKLVETKWKGFSAENIELPEDFILCVGWTRSGASTKELVLKIREFKKINKEKYWEIINAIRSVTEKLIEAISRKNKEGILKMIGENRKLLKELSDSSGSKLETNELATIAEIAEEHGAAGKFSGAGGGDCGIAVCFDLYTAAEINKSWKEAKLYPIDIEISQTGISAVE